MQIWFLESRLHNILQHLNENISLTLIQNVNHFYLHLNLRIRYPYNL